MHDALFDHVSFPRGEGIRSRLALAPLTNQQSHPDGTLSDEEHRWLTMRAEGGFALTMTCAAHVQAIGQGFCPADLDPLERALSTEDTAWLPIHD